MTERTPLSSLFVDPELEAEREEEEQSPPLPKDGTPSASHSGGNGTSSNRTSNKSGGRGGSRKFAAVPTSAPSHPRRSLSDGSQRRISSDGLGEGGKKSPRQARQRVRISPAPMGAARSYSPTPTPGLTAILRRRRQRTTSGDLDPLGRVLPYGSFPTLSPYGTTDDAGNERSTLSGASVLDPLNIGDPTELLPGGGFATSEASGSNGFVKHLKQTVKNTVAGVLAFMLVSCQIISFCTSIFASERLEPLIARGIKVTFPSPSPYPSPYLSSSINLLRCCLLCGH